MLTNYWVLPGMNLESYYKIHFKLFYVFVYRKQDFVLCLNTNLGIVSIQYDLPMYANTVVCLNSVSHEPILKKIHLFLYGIC